MFTIIIPLFADFSTNAHSMLLAACGQAPSEAAARVWPHRGDGISLATGGAQKAAGMALMLRSALLQ